jgi:excisionase family DNA binding protein
MSYRSASARADTKGECEGTALADQIERTPYALTVRELMAILQVSDQTIYRMVRDLTIPFFLVRGSYRFDPKKIAEWLRKRSMNVA